MQPWCGCISASDVGDIVRIDGITNAEKYRQDLINYAIPSGKRQIGNNLFRVTKHAANASKIIFGEKNFGLKYVSLETEFEYFIFELLNLNNCIKKNVIT